MDKEDIEQTAELCHELNRAYCQLLGDQSQPPWCAAPEWQKLSAIKGVEFHLANPDSKPEDSHISWSAQKFADGWIHGEVKDAEKKTHPCLVAYDRLPEAQKIKDVLFLCSVRAAVNMVGKPEEKV